MCPPPCDRENPFAHSCSFTLQTSYKNGMLGPGVLSKCSKTIYSASPSNQVTSIILLRTVACLYTYFYLDEHDLVFEKVATSGESMSSVLQPDTLLVNFDEHHWLGFRN